MAPNMFAPVWFLAAENKWSDLRLLAFTDVGTLVVHEDFLEFRGKKNVVQVNDIRKVSYERQGRDFANKWVKVEYGDGLVAFFADGSMLGWGGILGGTKRIFRAVQPLGAAVAK